jgi:hypothetical protein
VATNRGWQGTARVGGGVAIGAADGLAGELLGRLLEPLRHKKARDFAGLVVFSGSA